MGTSTERAQIIECLESQQARLIEPFRVDSQRLDRVVANSHFCELVRPAGLEPATPSLEGSCSIHLSYGRRAVSA